MDEDEAIPRQSHEADEEVERAELEQALAISASEALENGGMHQAIAASVFDSNTHGRLTREMFVSSAGRLLRLAMDGLPGCIHSMRSLRNLQLQRFGGDQHAAQKHVSEVTATSPAWPRAIPRCPHRTASSTMDAPPAADGPGTRLGR